MERLTERDEFGNADIIGVDSADLQLNLEFDDLNRVTDALNRLAAYEDTGVEPENIPTALEMAKMFSALQKLKEYQKAEMDGRLVVLPCKVGDTVYRIASGRVGGKTRASYSGAYVIQEFKIRCDYVTGNGLDMFAHMILDDGRPATSYEIFSSNNIGKTVFLTREDAEKALKGVSEGG